MNTAKQNEEETFPSPTVLERLCVLELINEDDNATLFQTIAQLPKPNRDTLAFLLLHLHKYVFCWSG